MFDLTDEMANAIDYFYDIEIPPIYQKLSRTGCMGCPYGRNIERELSLLNKAQFNFITRYHKESYLVKNVQIDKIKNILNY